MWLAKRFERYLIFLMILARCRSITQQRWSIRGDFQSLGSYEGHFKLEMTLNEHVSVADGHDFCFQVSYDLNYLNISLQRSMILQRFLMIL